MTGFIEWLESDRTRPFPARVAIVVAHPDDEIIGAGAQLPLLKQLQLLHVTDGAPRNLFDANRSGFSTRDAYASCRRQELETAMSLAGHPNLKAHTLGVVDQEASLDLVGITRRLVHWLDENRPAVLLSHPYEGGHPDHDATAFCVHAGCSLLDRQGLPVPEVIEMASYHDNAGQLAVGTFLPEGGLSSATVVLSENERQLKRRLLDSFPTQRETLNAFSIDAERFRPAPRYDFTQPPHGGTLWYERFDWGMKGPRWRELAREVLLRLKLEGPL